jgi:hypothetical protein
VLAQVAGYAVSKMIGVRVIAEIPAARRGRAILGLIGLSWVALPLFAILPAPWSVVAMFFNGLPLGMIWGLVFGYMEGRRTSEVLGAILCASFIVSPGAVKSVGKRSMDRSHISAFWMPAAMGAAERANFLGRYGVGIALLVVAYVMTTALRDFRDNFAAEIWTALGIGHAAGVFTASEVPVAVLLGPATLVWRNFVLAQLDWLQVFRMSAYATSILGSLLVARRWGIDRTRVNIVNLRVSEIPAAWGRGDIDAAYVWDPALGRIKDATPSARTSRACLRATPIRKPPSSGCCSKDHIPRRCSTSFRAANGASTRASS